MVQKRNVLFLVDFRALRSFRKVQLPGYKLPFMGSTQHFTHLIDPFAGTSAKSFFDDLFLPLLVKLAASGGRTSAFRPGYQHDTDIVELPGDETP